MGGGCQATLPLIPWYLQLKYLTEPQTPLRRTALGTRRMPHVPPANSFYKCYMESSTSPLTPEYHHPCPTERSEAQRLSNLVKG